MKTIKDKAGKIERVTDKEAFARVGTNWTFCPKQEWKDATRAPKEEKEVSSDEVPVVPKKTKHGKK